VSDNNKNGILQTMKVLSMLIIEAAFLNLREIYEKRVKGSVLAVCELKKTHMAPRLDMDRPDQECRAMTLDLDWPQYCLCGTAPELRPRDRRANYPRRTRRMGRQLQCSIWMHLFRGDWLRRQIYYGDWRGIED
jgi:hypothetical protein